MRYCKRKWFIVSSIQTPITCSFNHSISARLLYLLFKGSIYRYSWLYSECSGTSDVLIDGEGSGSAVQYVWTDESVCCIDLNH